MKWASVCIERIFNKHSLKPNAASHNDTSCYTDTDGFLEQSPRGEEPILQGVCPPEDNSDFGGFSCVYVYIYVIYIYIYTDIRKKNIRH